MNPLHQDFEPVEPIHVVILAAGLGTRMRSKKAKVLHEAGGLPLVEHVVRAARSFAPKANITLVVGHQADKVQSAMAHQNVQFTLQAEQKGTGHALLCARDFRLSTGLTVVLYGDTPLLTENTLSAILNHHRASGATGTVLTTFLADPTGYGRIIQGADGSVIGIVEQKAASPSQLEIREVNSGIYCFDSAALWPELERLEPNPASGEVYLTDLIQVFAASNRPVTRFVLKDPSELLGINNRLELSQADAILRRRKIEQLMLSGVTIERPDTCVIDLDVQVGMDTVIGPNTHLLGKTIIGEDCLVGPSVVIQNTTIGSGTTILSFSSIYDSFVHVNSHVGPFARLRGNSTVGAGSHIGNFVELKNAQLASGVKAGHLTYLGDCEIGEKTNVGAGTITCNYDGYSKNRTTVGSRVFLGSNTSLVAPVTVHDGAFTAAGSVVTADVPADSIAIARARQVNKEGWATEYHAKNIEKKKKPAE